MRRGAARGNDIGHDALQQQGKKLERHHSRPPPSSSPRHLKSCIISTEIAQRTVVCVTAGIASTTVFRQYDIWRGCKRSDMSNGLLESEIVLRLSTVRGNNGEGSAQFECCDPHHIGEGAMDTYILQIVSAKGALGRLPRFAARQARLKRPTEQVNVSCTAPSTAGHEEVRHKQSKASTTAAHTTGHEHCKQAPRGPLRV